MANKFQTIARGLQVQTGADGNPEVADGYVTLRVNVDPSRDTKASASGKMRLTAGSDGWASLGTGGFKFQFNGGFKA